MAKATGKQKNFLQTIELGLGAWSWGDRIVWNYGRGYTDEDIQATFQVSLEESVHFIDTAEVYGQGKSERLLGQLIQQSQQPVLVATKFFPWPWRWGEASIPRALHHSLERLGLKSVDLYQIHWPTPLMSIETMMEGMVEAVKVGLTLAVGVSNFNQTQMMSAYSALARHDIPLVSNQVKYSLLDRMVENNGLLAHCQELGVRLIAYSPLAQGLLTGKYTLENPPPGVRGRRYAGILPKVSPLLKLMTEIGQDHGGKSIAQVALNWCICKGTLPIPGAKTAQQAQQNAGALGWRLNKEQIAALDEASAAVTA
jgi:aryl-alcohol dehydrogenase-like predicted oxidoreductase